MNVVQIGPMPPPHGGVSSNMMAIHEALIRSGCRSRIIDVTNRNEVRTESFVIKPRSAMGLITVLTGLRCDIIHLHIGGDFNSRLAFLALFCGLLPGKRTVVTFHSGGFAREAMKFAKCRSLRGYAFRSSDQLIGVNDQMIEMFRLYGVPDGRMQKILPYELRDPDPAVQVPAELDQFIRRHDPFLLSVGALEPEYLNSLLIRAMPAVVKQFPNAGLIIAGSGSQEKMLREGAEASGLPSRILLPGNIDHGIVLHLIRRAAVLLRLTEYDGDAISVREARYLRTPVVASDNEMRPAGTFLLKMPSTVEQLVSAIVEARGAQFLGREMENKDRGNADKVIEVYRKLLQV